MFRRFCTCSVGMLSVMTLIISFVYIGENMYSRTNHQKCSLFLASLHTEIGEVLVVLSVIGLIGSCCRITCLLWIYLCIVLVLIIGLLIFLPFSWIAIQYGEPSVTPKLDVYRIEHYSFQVQGLLKKNWEKFKKCKIDDGSIVFACQFNDSSLSVPHNNKLAMESDLFKWGCCIPPMSCGYEHSNFNDWIIPKTTPVLEGNPEPDCSLWNNRKDMRCYECNKCKAKYLHDLRKEFIKIISFNSGLFVFLVFNFTVAIYAFKTNDSVDRHKKYEQEMVCIALDPTFDHQHGAYWSDQPINLH